MQGSNPGARHPTTQKQRAKQRPRQQRKGQQKQQQKKTTKRLRKNPTLVQARNCNQDGARKKTKTTRNTATKAPRKTGTKMTTPTLVPATIPPSWIKPMSWDPKMRSEKRNKSQHPEQGPPQLFIYLSIFFFINNTSPFQLFIFIYIYVYINIFWNFFIYLIFNLSVKKIYFLR